MDIEIKKPDKIKDISSSLYSKMEDAIFSIILKLPERFIPDPLMGWLDGYTTKRLQALHQKTIKDTWRKTCLEKSMDEIAEMSNISQK